MSETLEYPPIVMRRVDLAEFDFIAPWLVHRLTERHPNATPQQIISWLKSCIANNEHFFVRTDHACALAQVRRVPLERQPVATEVFCFAEADEWVHEAAYLYPKIASWAAHQDASTFEFDVFSDVKRGTAKTVMKINFVTRSTAHFVLGGA
jgi:hypothetical protein